MDKKYLGDSFDIVKRFWADRLATVAPLVAHPRFVPAGLKSEFERMVGMRVLDRSEIPVGSFGLFLDPHTGIPLPKAAHQTASASHAPLAFIEAEFLRLKPKYLVCFDQSHDRVPGLSRSDQRAQKRAALKARNVLSFYYVSHAPFLFAAMDNALLESLHSRLVEAGIPEWRFESEDLAPKPEADPMPVLEHTVSYRNGPQVMVAGLKLKVMGYRRGAAVRVSDPNGNPANEAWAFVVPNDEHATLVCKDPKPPSWIQPGARVRIEVSPPGSPPQESTPATNANEVPSRSSRPADGDRAIPPITASTLAEWRRALVQLLDKIETPNVGVREGAASRISRLSREGRIPPETAALMKSVTEMRNQTEYQSKVLTVAESAAVQAAWLAIQEWAKGRKDVI